ncbi:MAG: hypothetical protein OES24_11630 [Acidimicrobiia bacterium]|nr:hypothetical protein [Acidimicrobiia bacterium]
MTDSAPDAATLHSARPTGGAFGTSLHRNNKSIRRDRADALAADASTMYRRLVEDLQLELRQLRRRQEDLLDLSPTDADSLVPAADFDAEAFASDDHALSVQIRNVEIKLDLATARLNYLFGDAGKVA